MKYRKKPVVIEAIIWTGDNYQQVLDFTYASSYKAPDGKLTITTLEGDHRAEIGDYIIKGVKGEFYPCKPDIFAMTYESVE